MTIGEGTLRGVQSRVQPRGFWFFATIIALELLSASFASADPNSWARLSWRVVTPTGNTTAKGEPQSGSSKEMWRGPEKLAKVGKVKECCGYPLALPEGFRLSFYWLAYESDYAAEAYDTEIYTKSGFFIGRFPSAFVYELKLEGSGILRDGRVLNYSGECNYGMGTCFKTLELEQHPLGVGVQGRKLEPFRSIAVDPKMIPIGAPVYVPELVGVLMPDGSHHDGCLRADDMGGAIKNGKLDFFVESYPNFKFIADNLWWRLKATPTLEEPRCEYLRTRDPRERDNEHTDWVKLHLRGRAVGRAEKVAAAKTARNRAIAQAWVKRRYAQLNKGGAAAVARRK